LRIGGGIDEAVLGNSAAVDGWIYARQRLGESRGNLPLSVAFHPLHSTVFHPIYNAQGKAGADDRTAVS